MGTLSKRQQALERMAAFDGFQCPVCRAPLHAMEDGLRCQRGHAYDVARKGYVHLHHKTVASAYSKTLFEARRAVFEDGFYLPVLDALKDILLPVHPSALLDAGCGEGYYLSALSPLLPGCTLVGVDLSKEAVFSAAGRDDAALYCVGDLGDLPFRDGIFDAVLNILSPANYASFTRVLKKDGMLVKIMPGQAYLSEIRKRLPSAKAAYDENQVPSYLGRHMQVMRLQRLAYTRPLSPTQYAFFVAMTPMTEGLTSQEVTALLADPPDTITIDLQLAVCRAIE